MAGITDLFIMPICDNISQDNIAEQSIGDDLGADNGHQGNHLFGRKGRFAVFGVFGQEAVFPAEGSEQGGQDASLNAKKTAGPGT